VADPTRAAAELDDDCIRAGRQTIPEASPETLDRLAHDGVANPRSLSAMSIQILALGYIDLRRGGAKEGDRG
jgi:hypothetical protein